MAVTINDVAKLAGVSHTTVSWVIHDDPRISEKTKEKVMKAVRELDYHPNYTARSLVRGKSNTIALVAPFFSSTFELDILKGIEDGMDNSSTSYSLNIYSTRGDHEKVLHQILNEKRADALILLTISPDEKTALKFNKAKVPLILLEETSPYCHYITTDNYSGAREAVSSLIVDSRKKKIAIVVERENRRGLCQRERMNGYLKALEENHIPFNRDLLIEIDSFKQEEGQKIFSQLLDSGADAVFCAAGDMLAMGILLEARIRGIKIPERLAVVGFDDSQMCRLVYPSLTTVRQPLAEMGRKAWELAVNPPKGEYKTLVYPPSYIVRESV